MLGSGILAPMAERFYVNTPLAPGIAILQGAEARHLAAVCRCRPGEFVYLFDGLGSEARAEVTALGRHDVRLRVAEIEQPDRELPFQLHVAAPLPKGDRAHFLIEKLTELGATSFTPLRTRRSVVHPSASHLEKMSRYVVEASKQCGRTRLMRIEPAADWPGFVSRERAGLRLVAHPGGSAMPPIRGHDRLCAVGPEGGFTDEEIEQAHAAGWQVAGLGARTLRIETAALVLASWALYPGAR